MPVPREQPHTDTVASRHDAETVVLDFVQPIRPGRRSFGRGRQARFDKADQITSTHTQHARLIARFDFLFQPKTAVPFCVIAADDIEK